MPNTGNTLEDTSLVETVKRSLDKVEDTHQQIVEELRKHMGNIDYSSAVTFERMLAGAKRIALPQLFVPQLLVEQADDLECSRHFNLDGEVDIPKELGQVMGEEQRIPGVGIERSLFEETLNGLVSAVMGADRALFEMLRENLVSDHARAVASDDFRPESIALMRSLITKHMMPVASSVFSSNLWTTLLGDNTFVCMIDPSHKMTQVMNGRLGSLFGQNLLSDAFRMPNMKVMRESEWWTFASPELLGKYVVELDIIGVEELETKYVWKYRHRVSFSDIERRAYSALKVMPKVSIHAAADPKLFEKERRLFNAQ